MSLFLTISIIVYLLICHTLFKQMLIIWVVIWISLHSIHHFIKEYIIFTCWKEFTPWYCYITVINWCLNINNSIIWLIESTVVNPYIRASLFYCHIIPVITIISTFCIIVPLPYLIKFNISYDDIIRACYIYTCMCNLSSILRVDCKITHICKLKHWYTCL